MNNEASKKKQLMKEEKSAILKKTEDLTAQKRPDSREYGAAYRLIRAYASEKRWH